MTEMTERRELIEASWSDYCDLDSWIEDMTSGSDSRNITKNIMKMAMKHLRDDFHRIHEYLCKKEEAEDDS